MECETGKTFTSLRIVEDLVEQGAHLFVLFPAITLVPRVLRCRSSNIYEEGLSY